ncbi:MAG: hypothetical protein JWL79_1145 [Frankiales bacterium]|nr:hypothetical protein [Frankiales bacterium]
MTMAEPSNELAGMDAPRPLPADLRARLEEQLLAGLDEPRPLEAAHRNALARALPRPRRTRYVAPGAAAAAIVVAVGVVLLSDGKTTPPRHAAVAPVQSTVSTAAGETTTTSDQEAGAPVPVPVPAPAPTTVLDAGSPLKAVALRLQLSPSTGPLSGSLTQLSGPRLATVTQVLFGGVAGSGIVVHADGTLTVRTPPAPSARSVDVTVVRADGSRLTAPSGYRYRAA